MEFHLVRNKHSNHGCCFIAGSSSITWCRATKDAHLGVFWRGNFKEKESVMILARIITASIFFYDFPHVLCIYMYNSIYIYIYVYIFCIQAYVYIYFFTSRKLWEIKTSQILVVSTKTSWTNIQPRSIWIISRVYVFIHKSIVVSFQL